MALLASGTLLLVAARPKEGQEEEEELGGAGQVDATGPFPGSTLDLALFVIAMRFASSSLSFLPFPLVFCYTVFVHFCTTRLSLLQPPLYSVNSSRQRPDDPASFKRFD